MGVGGGGGGGGWVAGSIETKTISASNLKLKLRLTEAELGNSMEINQGCCRYVLLVQVHLVFTWH